MKLGKVFEGSQRPTSYSIDIQAPSNMTRLLFPEAIKKITVI